MLKQITTVVSVVILSCVGTVAIHSVNENKYDGQMTALSSHVSNGQISESTSLILGLFTKTVPMLFSNISMLDTLWSALALLGVMYLCYNSTKHRASLTNCPRSSSVYTTTTKGVDDGSCGDHTKNRAWRASTIR